MELSDMSLVYGGVSDVLLIGGTVRLTKLITEQAAATVFCGVACTLTGLHPFIHHLESGVLDSVLDYLYAASLNAMNHRSN